MRMFRKARERHYQRKVRMVVSKLSGIPPHRIPFSGMPKNDQEFEELLTVTKDWVSWLRK